MVPARRRVALVAGTALCLALTGPVGAGAHRAGQGREQSGAPVPPEPQWVVPGPVLLQARRPEPVLVPIVGGVAVDPDSANPPRWVSSAPAAPAAPSASGDGGAPAGDPGGAGAGARDPGGAGVGRAASPSPAVAPSPPGTPSSQGPGEQRIDRAGPTGPDVSPGGAWLSRPASTQASRTVPAWTGAPLVLRPPPTPAPVGAPLDPARVRRALAPLLSGGALGRGRTPAQVVDVATGQVLYSVAGSTVPASTMKLITAVSALDALGADTVLRTRTELRSPDAAIPRVVIVGAGDPSLRSVGSKVGGTGASLSPASLEELAAATARALRERRVRGVRIGFDDSLFVGPALHPSWSSSFPAGGVVAPVSALQVDQGRRTPTGIARVSDPAAAAAARFAELLADQGIKVRGGAARVGGSSGATRLAFVESPSVGVLVERTLASSDNDYAEALGRLAARAAGEPAGFAGVGRRAEGLLAGLGVPIAGARFADASGLSRRNRLTPGQLTALLEVTASRYGHVASGLPVAGAIGSLRDRFGVSATEPGRGVVRAKTGTLTGVVGLAGYTSRPDGRLLAFAFLDDDSVGPPLAMRRAVDQAAAELAACDCAAG